VVTSSKDFAMQNCFVSIIFLSKLFNSTLVLCETIFFAERTELIPSFIVNIALDTAFSNAMLKIFRRSENI
jgi:hypothetical protein